MASPRPAPLRRRNLLIGGVAGLAVAAAAAESGWSVWGSVRSGPHRLPPAPTDGPVHLQIVAHPDDCLYFINPRIARVLDDGAAVCTVVLTAGEADGRNNRSGTGPADYAGYAAARNNGLRRAYAHLATGDAESPWERTGADLDSGQQVEVCVLTANPNVQLIFCSLWTNFGRITGRFTRLLSLWQGDLGTSPVLPPTGSAISGDHGVERSRLTRTLIELLDHYRPSVVNTLDPDPDPVADAPFGAEQTGYSDHIDHTAVALFAWDAARTWGGGAAIESWRGYYNRRWPANLGAADRDAKGAALDVYAWADGADCGDPVGCGDRLIVGPDVGDTYGVATHPRYHAGLVAVTADSGLRPFVVDGTRLRYHDTDVWADAGGPDVLPALAAAGGLVIAVAAEHAHEPDAHVRDVHCFDPLAQVWTDLGNPAGAGEAARRIGPPAAADDGHTTLVAVRGPHGGVHVRTRGTDEPDGEWQAWTHLDGPAVHDSPAALATADGRFIIVAATADGLAWWERDGEEWAAAEPDLPHVGGEPGYVPASAVTAAPAPDGRVVIASRAAGSADIVLHVGLRDSWSTTLLPLDGGILPPTVAIGPDGTVAVAADDGTGAPAVTVLPIADMEREPGEAGPDIHWSRGDLVLLRRPVAVFDRTGRLRLWGTAADGEVRAATVEPGAAPPTTWAPALRSDD